MTYNRYISFFFKNCIMKVAKREEPNINFNRVRTRTAFSNIMTVFISEFSQTSSYLLESRFLLVHPAIFMNKSLISYRPGYSIICFIIFHIFFKDQVKLM